MQALWRKPVWVAALIVVIIIVWMLSGLWKSDSNDESSAVEQGSLATPLRVRVRDLIARPMQREIVSSGESKPERAVTLRSQVDGRVESLRAERGAAVSVNQVLLVLDQRDRELRVQEAVALVHQRELEYEGIQDLLKKGFASEVQEAQALTLLENARAALTRSQLDLENTQIKAPFAGLLQERMVEQGDFVRVGDSIAHLVDLDPIIISANVNENELRYVSKGALGTAILADGSQVEGRVNYISPMANNSTHTFQVELEVANPNNEIAAGASAQLTIFGEEIIVHELSAGVLSLADDGEVGVKVVDAQDKVQYYPVNIVSSSDHGVAVTGLPKNIRLITVGQAYVQPGQKVESVLEKDSTKQVE